jgi:hypothetical protein
MGVLAKEVLWNRVLPEQVFSRKPAVSLFFDGGLLENEGFLEDLVGWSGSAFAEDEAVLVICEREGSRLLGAESFGLSKMNLSRDCGAAKRHWLSKLGVQSERTCVVFNKGIDWMLYEEELEDFGVLVLFAEHNAVTHGQEWLALSRHFFTKSDIESALAQGSGSNLSAIYTREFLTGLMANY